MFTSHHGRWIAVGLLIACTFAGAGGAHWLARGGQLPAGLRYVWPWNRPQTPQVEPAPGAAEGCNDVGRPDPARMGAEVSGLPPGFDDPVLHQLLKQYDTPVLMAAYKTNFDHAIPSQAGNIALTARRLAGTVLQPGEVFSQNGRLGPYDKAHGYGEGRMFVGTRIVPSVGGGVCQIATTLYNVVILSDLQVLARKNHGLTVPYVPPGQDATVAEGYLDFKFKNTTGAPLVIWAATQGRWLYIGFFGREAPPQVIWHHETLSTTPFTTEVVTNPELPPGAERVRALGQNGVTVRSWITIGTGDQQRTKDLGIDTYRASPRVIERGPNAKSH